MEELSSLNLALSASKAPSKNGSLAIGDRGRSPICFCAISGTRATARRDAASACARRWCCASPTSEGAPLENALDAAVAVEIFHNYSLVHDDIEDRDELRHGRRTLWSAYGVAAGDQRRRRDVRAQLSQPRARRRASRPAARACDDRAAARGPRRHVRRAVARSALRIGNVASTSTGYHRMIECKTAQLFDASCRLGAHAAGCDERRSCADTARSGRAYGMAFQIRDDVSGIWSSVDETGKVTGSDVARRKWTLPGRVGDRPAAVCGAATRWPTHTRSARPLDEREVSAGRRRPRRTRRERGGARRRRRTSRRHRAPPQRSAARVFTAHARSCGRVARRNAA